jgi:hypothetical protein
MFKNPCTIEENFGDGILMKNINKVGDGSLQNSILVIH